ncbi:hypothetical protein DFH07DRAFT_91681 [Mycena maculata]|uniref:BZIP domain-containing protein n=1 Tax=Mycena maculata TaxID=230809 RepID=A0AAD7MYQ6_9AGAR|nr:hypothetical protein DFH07DRAFT_91681 [Mycena maculata]
MAPSTLHGLNLVPHIQSNTARNLRSGPPLPALLWNTLDFGSDEPHADDEGNERETDGEPELEANRQARESVQHRGNVSIVKGGSRNASNLNSLPASSGQSPATISPSVIQLLSTLRSNPPPASFGQSPATISPSVIQLFSTLRSNPPPIQPQRSSPDDPPAKRARGRRSSTSISISDSLEDSSATSAVDVEEDKRRRNTIASARFRLRKKEKEAAMEIRAKELKGRVNKLERECEDLRRENRWLKALIIGADGPSQAPEKTYGGSQNSLKRSRDELQP